MTVLPAIGQSLAEGFFMFWATLWALIFGFTLLGVVQAFVSRHEMHRAMGEHKPATVVRTGLLGAASSSCSYAATALAKSLFQRGADFTSAMVFMVASHVKRLVDGLVADSHGLVLWEVDLQPVADLLRTPRRGPLPVLPVRLVPALPRRHGRTTKLCSVWMPDLPRQSVLDIVPQPVVGGELGGLGTLGSLLGLPLCHRGPITALTGASSGIATQLG